MDNARAKPGIQDNDDADPRRMPKVCKVEAKDAVNDDADPQRMPKVSVEAKDEVNDDADPQRMPKACKVEEKDDDDADNPAADDIKDEAADEQDDIKDEAEDDEKGKVSEVAILLDQLTAFAEMMIESKAPDSQKKQDVDIVLRYAEQAIEEGEHVHIDCDLGKRLDRIEKEWTEFLPQKAQGPTEHHGGRISNLLHNGGTISTKDCWARKDKRRCRRSKARACGHGKADAEAAVDAERQAVPLPGLCGGDHAKGPSGG